MGPYFFINIILTLITMPFVVRKKNYGCIAFFFYFVIVATLTPVFGIPFYILLRKMLVD